MQNIITFTAITSPNLKVRSNRRAHNVAFHCSPRPNLRIQICHTFTEIDKFHINMCLNIFLFSVFSIYRVGEKSSYTDQHAIII
jgi:hypothetical protein